MTMFVWVIVFMCVWFGGVAIGTLAVIDSYISGQTVLDWFALIPFGMLVFGVALVAGGFWFEALKQKPMLEDIFKGKIIANHERVSRVSTP